MSWIEDFLGGAAGTGADILKERQVRDDRMAEQEAQETRRLKYMEQQEALAEKKMQVQEALKEARRKEAQARSAQERTESEQAGSRMADERDAKGLSLPSNQSGPNMDAETASTMSASQRKQYQDAGMIQPRTQLGMLDDAKQAARGMGYYDTAEAIGKDRKVAFDDKVQSDKLLNEERRNAINDERVRISEKRADATIAAIGAKTNGSTGGKSGESLAGEKLEITKARERRLDLKDQISMVIKKRENGLVSQNDAKVELADLQAKQAKYEKIIEDFENSGTESTKKPTVEKIKPALPMPSTKDGLQKGSIYDTKRGPAKWNGSAFEPV